MVGGVLCRVILVSNPTTVDVDIVFFCVVIRVVAIYTLNDLILMIDFDLV